MSYYNDLSYELRRRGCEEDSVAEVLHTVDDAVTSSGKSPEEEFGTAKEYAAQYEGPRKSTPGQRALGLFGFIGVVCVAIYAIWPQWFNISTPVLEQFAGIFALVVLVVIGALVGAFVDNRLPSGFTSTQPKNPVQ